MVSVWEEGEARDVDDVGKHKHSEYQRDNIRLDRVEAHNANDRV